MRPAGNRREWGPSEGSGASEEGGNGLQPREGGGFENDERFHQASPVVEAVSLSKGGLERFHERRSEVCLEGVEKGTHRWGHPLVASRQSEVTRAGNEQQVFAQTQCPRRTVVSKDSSDDSIWVCPSTQISSREDLNKSPSCIGSVRGTD